MSAGNYGSSKPISYVEQVGHDRYITRSTPNDGSTGWNIAGKEIAPGLNQFSGNYVADEHQAGMLGGAEYYKQYALAEAVRTNPDAVQAQSARDSVDEPFMSVIAPEKPAAVALAGYDTFGPMCYFTSTRNMSLDIRGEAAAAPAMTGEIPEGASISSLAAGTVSNLQDCAFGCGCTKKPSTAYAPAGGVHMMKVGSAGGILAPSGKPVLKVNTGIAFPHPV